VRRSPIGARAMPVTASTTGGKATEEAAGAAVEEGFAVWLVGSRKDIFVFLARVLGPQRKRNMDFNFSLRPPQAGPRKNLSIHDTH
jgi:hypothetical protein